MKRVLIAKLVILLMLTFALPSLSSNYTGANSGGGTAAYAAAGYGDKKWDDDDRRGRRRSREGKWWLRERDRRIRRAIIRRILWKKWLEQRRKKGHKRDRD
jgi:hypothetical protein